MEDRVECRGRRVAFTSRIEELPNGVKLRVDRVTFPNSVTVLPITTRDCTVYLIKQYRPAVGEWLLEAPAGVIDPGESPEEAASRELAEETGLHGGKLVKIAEGYTSPGYSTEYMYIYLALDPEHGEARPENYEVIEELVKLSITEALSMIREAKIRDLKTVYSIIAGKDYCSE